MPLVDPDMVVLGDINVDHVVARDLTFPLSSIAENGMIYWEDIEELPGGTALNFCSFATDAGYRCLLLGKVGNDSAGSVVTAWLASRGIDIPRRWTAAAPTGKSLIMRDSAGIRLIINNRDNANQLLTTEDVEDCSEALSRCRLLCVSGYCVGEPSAPRYAAAVRAMGLVRNRNPTATVVFDLVPHRLFERLSFEQLGRITQHVDVLVSEAATLRRFLGLGSRSETVNETTARETAALAARWYSRLILRYGPSGCDEEILVDVSDDRVLHRRTGHDATQDKRGFGDRLTIDALRGFFGVLPADKAD